MVEVMEVLWKKIVVEEGRENLHFVAVQNLAPIGIVSCLMLQVFKRNKILGPPSSSKEFQDTPRNSEELQRTLRKSMEVQGTLRNSEEL